MSGAEGKPVLLTEEQLRAMLACAGIEDGWRRRNIVDVWRDSGLIAPEPVDPLLVEVDNVIASVRHTPHCRSQAGDACHCWHEYGDAIALAALRRGMELAPAARLTREMVREAHKDTVWRFTPLQVTCTSDAFVTRLHTALTQQMEGRDERPQPPSPIDPKPSSI